MKELNFNSNQIVKIENKEQFDAIYPELRSAKRGISLETWIKEINKGYPQFPIYLEHINSIISGPSIGYTYSLWNSRTNQQYEILSFNKALI